MPTGADAGPPHVEASRLPRGRETKHQSVALVVAVAFVLEIDVLRLQVCLACAL